MSKTTPSEFQLTVHATSKYIEQQSDPDNGRFVFSYTVVIKNISDTACQLMSRHWLIQDANNKVEEVYGEGVIGQQPVIQPGKQFSYTSGAVLETEMGTMQGRYFFLASSNNDKADEFEIPIEKFILSVPRTLH